MGYISKEKQDGEHGDDTIKISLNVSYSVQRQFLHNKNTNITFHHMCSDWTFLDGLN